MDSFLQVPLGPKSATRSLLTESQYYLTLILDSIGYTTQDKQTLINGILTIWNLVTTLFFSFLVNKFKRRTMFLTSTIAMLVCYVGKCFCITLNIFSTNNWNSLDRSRVHI